MPASTDRLNARLAILGRRLHRLVTCLPCVHPLAPVHYLDVRVRDIFAGNLPVSGAAVTVTDPLGVHGAINVVTDLAGDVIVPLPAAGNWDVSAGKEWHVPEPAQQAGVNVHANQLRQVQLTIEELRYYLHVDADRDGTVDGQHEGLNVIPAWQWGAPPARGAVILCNNDHDDGLPARQRQRDNADNVVNHLPDEHEIAHLEIRRVGPATAPALLANWAATLDILNGDEDKVRIFATPNAGAAQLLGAAWPGGAANAQHVIALRTPAPASYPGAILGMEAVTFPRAGFAGPVQVRLTISKNGMGGVGVVSYFTGAEMRVAPWLVPNHTDDARRVYVADLGPDVANGGRPDEGGNATFRGALGGLLVPAGIAGGNYVEIVSEDRWMQDCMEIGYSVLPQNTGGGTRHRIEATLQTFRFADALDLKGVPRSLLDQDFGYQESPGPGAAVQLAIAGGVASPAYQAARAAALAQIGQEGLAGNLAPTFTALQAAAGWPPYLMAANNAADAAANAILLGIERWGSADIETALDARDALLALGAPWVGGVADAIAENALVWVAHPAGGVAPPLYSGNTLDSGGNLECTPPCHAGAMAAAVAGHAVANKDFPWGRIYYGGGAPTRLTYDADTQQFLEAQRVQAPMSLDTNWLEVGHVDEMMSFIPDPAGPAWRRWRLLLASPAQAYHILNGLPGGTVVLTGRQLPFPNAGWTAVQTTANVLTGGVVATPVEAPAVLYDNVGAAIGGVGAWLTAQQLRDYNLNVVQPHIDAVANQLVTEIGAMLADIIRVPVIFFPKAAAQIPGPGGGGLVQTNLAGALTADMVNMLVANNHCIVPDPHGPIYHGTDVFRHDLQTAILAANPGLTVSFLNDWYPYHCNEGEVHCGTNTNRHPANLPNWLASQAAEWWRFSG